VGVFEPNRKLASLAVAIAGQFKGGCAA